MKLPALTQTRLKELLRYDPETGLFTHLQQRAGAYAGVPAGSLSKKGAIVIRLDWKIYYAHRLAWLYVVGEWPPSGVDHRDLDPTNNRWANLRLANQSQNCANTKKRTTMNGVPCASKYKGVTPMTGCKRWIAQITFGKGQHLYLGSFDTEEEAHCAYVKAAEKYHVEFARAA